MGLKRDGSGIGRIKESLNSAPHTFDARDVLAGGLQALKILGEPKDIINEAKKRLFTA